jgi:hypothetical protein
MSLLDARGWLNDRKGKAVRVEVMLEPTDAYASSVVTLNGLLLFWRDRFPEAGNVGSPGRRRLVRDRCRGE